MNFNPINTMLKPIDTILKITEKFPIIKVDFIPMTIRESSYEFENQIMKKITIQEAEFIRKHRKTDREKYDNGTMLLVCQVANYSPTNPAKDLLIDIENGLKYHIKLLLPNRYILCNTKFYNIGEYCEIPKTKIKYKSLINPFPIRFGKIKT